jgi:hypothetical protein
MSDAAAPRAIKYFHPEIKAERIAGIVSPLLIKLQAIPALLNQSCIIITETQAK